MLQRSYTWLVAFMLGLALLLTACGETSSITDPPPTARPGSLEIVVQGVEQAQVVVVSAGTTIFDGVVVGSHTINNLNPGDYAVDGMPADRCIDPSARAVTVMANKTTRVEMVYVQMATPATTKPVASLEIKAVQDDRGRALPAQAEINDVKDVMLYAAQTEEPVCVMVEAKDASGQAAANAQLAITIADGTGISDRIAIMRGCDLSGQSLNMTPLAFRDGIFTDDSGKASFTLYATYGSPEDASHIFAKEPAKVVIGAENEDASLAIAEFKAFFFNISHLYFNKTYTDQRIGASFDEFNIFNPQGNNEFGMQVDLYTKQPSEKLDVRAVGFFRFEILEELNKAGQAADVVHFDNYGDLISSGLNDVAVDRDGYITVVPNAGIKLTDLPIQAKIKTYLIVQVTFGDHTYNFRLKDFTVTKRWHGSYLTIDKQVDHHVLTWAGPEHHLYEAALPKNLLDHTLAAKDDAAVTAASVFTATYTLTVTNAGSEALYDITLADALPAELGVISTTLSPAGATYDAVNHVVTWNWLAVPDTRFEKLEPGQSISATLEVYLRQKPGFCMDPEDLRLSQTYQVAPVGTRMNETYCYPDPYAVIDGKDPDDVTATFYTGAALDDGGHQVKVDYLGEMHKGDVILYGVRPVFSIDKKLVDPKRTLEVGEVAYFDIAVANTYRAKYDSLEASYPTEFKGPRYNPYGRNVQVKDVFDTGLDFVSSSALSVSGTSYSANFVTDKAVRWNTVPLMDYRATGSARIALRADLPSPLDMTMTATDDIGVTCDPEDDYWYNCAFLDADNLNQPETEPWNADRAWTQMEMRPWSEAPLHHSMHENLRYGIKDCEGVKVVAPPGKPWIELDSVSEYSLGDPNTATALAGVSDGDIYYYYFTITNTGQGIAEDVALEAKLDCGGDPAQVTASTSAHRLWVYDTTSSSWLFVASASFAGPEAGQCTVRFPAQDLSFGDPDPVFLYSIETTANNSGGVHINAKASYSNASLQAALLPLTVTEDTSISP
ncbi:MAG: DUF11 domain-containing protein [Trueperaceae bacterium]|nr:DUF11 domain-containing protein [Trueperaceae bacterium]